LIRGTDTDTMSDRPLKVVARWRALLVSAAGKPKLGRARMLLVTALVVAAALVASAAALAGPSAPPPAARNLALSYFTTGLTRAEVVSIAGRAEHDYRIDEGRIVAIRPGSIDLLERDGTRQTIPVAGRVFGLLRGTRVVTVRDNGGPATQVRPSGQARVLGRAFFGATFVRAEVLFYVGKAAHDYRIDEGRIVSAKAGSSITLLERDGTRQAIPISASTVVSANGQPVDQSALVKGQTAVTIREGDGPAEQILLATGLALGRR